MENDLLQKLGKERLDELITRYYSDEKIADLIEEFQLDIKVSGLLKLFPLKELKENKCPYCQISLKQYYRARSSSKYHQPIAFCEVCGHRDISHCVCSKCEAIRNEKRLYDLTQRQIKISNIQRTRTINVKLLELSLMQAISLLGMCRIGRSEDSDLISPVSTYHPELTPVSLMTVEVVQSLYDAQLIDITLSTPKNTVSFDDAGNLIGFDLLNVYWRLNLSADKSVNISLIEELENIVRKKELWPNGWVAEVTNIWKELALNQCYKYLQIHVEEHGFEFRAGQKTRKILSTLHEDFSILKSYYFIWVAVHNAASYYLKSGKSKRQAANIIIGDIQRRAERALAEGWDIKEYSKDSRCGESVIVAMFSNVVTNLGKDFFTQKPTNIVIQQSKH